MSQDQQELQLIFLTMNAAELQLVNLALQVNQQALNNVGALVQRQTDMMAADRRRRGQQTRPKSKWTKAWYKRREELGWYNTLLRELATEEEKDYFNFMRMDEDFFNEIVERIGPSIARKRSNFRPPMPPGLLLSMALR